MKNNSKDSLGDRHMAEKIPANQRIGVSHLPIDIHALDDPRYHYPITDEEFNTLMKTGEWPARIEKAPYLKQNWLKEHDGKM